jgi:hypothetical protein
VNRSTGSLLLALTLLGTLGLQVELAFLDHAESATQWIPHIVLAIGLLTILAFYIRPTPVSLKVFKLVMWVFILTGVLGVYFHFAGNAEFARERRPGLSGVELIWRSLRGATPALAPGALVQLGLLGLIFVYRYGIAGRTESNKPQSNT